MMLVWFTLQLLNEVSLMHKTEVRVHYELPGTRHSQRLGVSPQEPPLLVVQHHLHFQLMLEVGGGLPAAAAAAGILLLDGRSSPYKAACMRMPVSTRLQCAALGMLMAVSCLAAHSMCLKLEQACALQDLSCQHSVMHAEHMPPSRCCC